MIHKAIERELIDLRQTADDLVSLIGEHADIYVQAELLLRLKYANEWLSDLADQLRPDDAA